MKGRFRNFLGRVDLLLHSIRFRLALWVVLILGLVIAAFSTFIYITQARELRADAINRLEAKSDSLDHILHDAIHQQPFSNSPGVTAGDPLSGQILLESNDILALFRPDGQLIQNWGPTNSQKLPALLNFTPGPGHEGVFYSSIQTNDHPKSTDYVFMASPITVDNKLAGFFLLGSPIDPSERLNSLLIRLILGGLGTLALALAGGFWLSDRAMRPVKTIIQTVQSMNETDLSRRLRLRGRDEIGQLAATFDQMLDRLEAAFERQRRFTADASHELRTPLTIINLETSRALSAPRSQVDYQRALGVIQSENEFMTRLVSDLLTLARMDAGHTVIAKEPLDLSDLALEAVERLAPLASRQGVQLDAGELPEVNIQGDRQYLLQMLTNLIENGLKYTAQKGENEQKCVMVETGTDSAQALGWVQVCDTGSGIPAEHLPHLFDRFYRVDQARTRNPELSSESSPSGSGLGLAIVAWIARLHGGKVEIQSQVGKGSTFSVTFPILKTLDK